MDPARASVGDPAAAGPRVWCSAARRTAGVAGPQVPESDVDDVINNEATLVRHANLH